MMGQSSHKNIQSYHYGDNSRSLILRGKEEKPYHNYLGNYDTFKNCISSKISIIPIVSHPTTCLLRR